MMAPRIRAMTPRGCHRLILSVLGALWFAAPLIAWQADNQPATAAASVLPAAETLPYTSDWQFGMTIRATSDTSGIQATVPVPLDWPEQTVEVVSIDKPDSVSVARIKADRNESSHLYFKVGQLPAGQQVTVTVRMKIQKLASGVPPQTDRFVFDTSPGAALRKYLTPSPFIESRDPAIVALAESIPVDSRAPAWNQVETIYDWVRDNIEYQFDPEIRTCLSALENRRGDCEELSSLFIAICRARGIPAAPSGFPITRIPSFICWMKTASVSGSPVRQPDRGPLDSCPNANQYCKKGTNFGCPVNARSCATISRR